MKICVSATAPGPDAQVNPRFGRCQYFTFVDLDTRESESVENPGITASGGAGIQAAQVIANKGVAVVLTGNVGPNAYTTLQAAGIKIITGVSGAVSKVVEAYKNGRLKPPVSGPTVGSHSGMGGPAQPSGQGIGTGGGMGIGRGKGGWGRWMGRRMGMPSSEPYPSNSSPQPAVSKEQEINVLKEQSQALKEQLDAITQRIGKIEQE